VVGTAAYQTRLVSQTLTSSMRGPAQGKKQPRSLKSYDCLHCFWYKPQFWIFGPTSADEVADEVVRLTNREKVESSFLLYIDARFGCRHARPDLAAHGGLPLYYYSRSTRASRQSTIHDATSTSTLEINIEIQSQHMSQ
jgi:hypothetical protein